MDVTKKGEGTTCHDQAATRREPAEGKERKERKDQGGTVESGSIEKRLGKEVRRNDETLEKCTGSRRQQKAAEMAAANKEEKRKQQ